MARIKIYIHFGYKKPSPQKEGDGIETVKIPNPLIFVFLPLIS